MPMFTKVLIVDSSGVPVAGTGGGAATIADGADVNEGTTADAKVTGDTAGTTSAKLRGLNTVIGTPSDTTASVTVLGRLINLLSRFPAALGQGTMAQSLTVAVASDQSAIAVNSELPAAAALTDADANPTVPGVGSYLMGWDSANSLWHRIRIATTGADAGALYVSAGKAVTPIDAQTNTSNGLISSDSNSRPLLVLPELYNGVTWDRQRANLDVTLLASAARTVTTAAADQTNYNGRGVKVVLDMSVVGTGSVTLTIQGKDSISGNYYTILAGAAVTTNSTNVYTVYPGAVVAANVSANDFLPRTWRVNVVANNANSATYSVSASVVL